MANPDTRPLFHFDFGARENEETLRTRLLVEAEICLASAGRPQRQFLDELRAYIVKNKGSDARIYPILRIIHRYMNVTPSDFRDLINLLGIEKSLEFIDGVRPTPQVWHTINRLRTDNAPPEYINQFWNQVLDGIESGVTDPRWYDDLSYHYVYTRRRLRPDRDRVTSSR